MLLREEFGMKLVPILSLLSATCVFAVVRQLSLRQASWIAACSQGGSGSYLVSRLGVHTVWTDGSTVWTDGSGRHSGNPLGYCQGARGMQAE
eukprot:1413922-Amphidinium_carterae.3